MYCTGYGLFVGESREDGLCYDVAAPPRSRSAGIVVGSLKGSKGHENVKAHSLSCAHRAGFLCVGAESRSEQAAQSRLQYLQSQLCILDEYPKAPAACLEGRAYKGTTYAESHAKVYINNLPGLRDAGVMNVVGTMITLQRQTPRGGDVLRRRQGGPLLI